MLPKVARIHQLIADGFELDEIDSDHGVVEAHLRRDMLMVAIRLLPSEAEALLLDRSYSGRPRRPIARFREAV